MRRSGSRSIRVSRLYDGTRRAKPIVSTSGSSTPCTQPSSAGLWPRCSIEARSRRRTSTTSRPRSARLVDQMTSDGSSSTTSKASRPSLVASACTSRATQVGACTPLVIDAIGTSAGSKPGQSPANIHRLTSPCSTLTPLARWASRRPITAMLNTLVSPPG